MLDRSTATPHDPQAPAPYANDGHEAAHQAADAPRQRAQARVGRGALYRRPARAGRACCTSIVGLSERAHARIAVAGSRRGARVARRGAGAHRPGRAGRATRSARPTSTTSRCWRPDLVEYLGQPIFAVAATDAPRGPRGGAPGRRGLRGPAGGARRRRRPARGGVLVTEPLTLAARRCRAGHRRSAAAGSRAGCASAARIISISRARSRWPSRARTATCKVWSSTQHPSETQHIVSHVLGVPEPHGAGRGAPHGRRLRRQGNPGQRVRLPGRHRGPEDRARRQAAARPRRRHDRHRQAPRFRDRLRGRLRRRGPHPRRRDDVRPRAAAIRPTCPGR